jgi:hypothetical protein
LRMRIPTLRVLVLMFLMLAVGCAAFALHHRAQIRRKLAALEDLETPRKATLPEPPLTELAPGYMRAPYLQSLGTDSVLVAWIASAAGAPEVDYGTTPDCGLRALASSNGDRRVATLRHLTPGTRYYYRVRAGSRVLASGPEYSLRTDGGREESDFSFFVTGDIGVAGGEQRTTAQSILRANPRPSFGVIPGDVVLERGDSHQYDAHLMRPWRELLAQMPIWPALGNHDWLSPPETNWCVEWYLPNNEHYYSFDYGNAHFIALDNKMGQLYEPELQLAWLENDLRAHAKSDWLFVYFHYPGITCTYKAENETVIHALMPLFDRYHVDVVFNGHAHTYERLYPLREGKPVNVQQDPNYTAPAGTLYIVSGCGGKLEPGAPTRRCGTTAFSKDETILWTRARVQGTRCTIETFASATDQRIDAVTITKPHLVATHAATPAQPISADSAQSIATARMPGATPLTAQLEMEDGRLVYSLYFKRPKHAGVEEINVDAMTGAVVGVEHERAADRDAPPVRRSRYTRGPNSAP